MESKVGFFFVAHLDATKFQSFTRFFVKKESVPLSEIAYSEWVHIPPWEKENHRLKSAGWEGIR